MPASTKKNDPIPLADLPYEEALAELESIVASLEANELSLDETMALYERGQALTRHCIDLLDKAELRVRKLAGDTLVDQPLEG